MSTKMEQGNKRIDIVIIANFCGNLDGSDNNRFVYLAPILEKDCDVELITSDFNHIDNRNMKYHPKSFRP